MRIVPFILIVLGIYLLVAAGYDEYRGATTRPFTLMGGHRHGMGQAYLYRFMIHREQNPGLFREFMIGHWIWAAGIEGVGWFLFLKNKGSVG